MAYGAGHQAPSLGTVDAEGLERLAIPAGHLFFAGRAQVGTAPYQSPPLQTSRSRKPLPVRQGYALWAETYDADPNPLLRVEERVLRTVLTSVVNKVVLDVACGTGRWLEKARSSGARAVAGIDLSAGMLQVARLKPSLQHRLVKGDCLALPFATAIADVVICSFVLGHLGNLEVFAQEIARVAKRPSDVYVTEMHPEARARGWRTGFRHRGGNAEIATFSHSVEQIHQVFRCQGFELSQCLEPCVGDAEKLIFAQAGKAHLFPSAREMPAVLVCHFRRACA
jgi:ubiquinone/menaquinone biosynthesis C-methylase UbiE